MYLPETTEPEVLSVPRGLYLGTEGQSKLCERTSALRRSVALSRNATSMFGAAAIALRNLRRQPEIESSVPDAHEREETPTFTVVRGRWPPSLLCSNLRDNTTQFETPRGLF